MMPSEFKFTSYLFRDVKPCRHSKEITFNTPIQCADIGVKLIDDEISSGHIFWDI